MKYFITCLLCLVSFLLFNCKASNRDNQTPGDLHSVVKPYLGETYLTDYNSSKTFALCQEKRQGDHMNRKFKYAIVRIADLKIIHQDTFQKGHVQWITDEAVEVATIDQRAASEQVQKKIIPVKSSQ